MGLALELTGSLTNDESKSFTVCFSQLPIPLLDLDFFVMNMKVDAAMPVTVSVCICSKSKRFRTVRYFDLGKKQARKGRGSINLFSSD